MLHDLEFRDVRLRRKDTVTVIKRLPKTLHQWLVILLVALLAYPQHVYAIPGITVTDSGPTLDTYEEHVTDIEVTVLGGQLSVTRYWKGKKWVFNPFLAPLVISGDSITHADITYTPTKTSTCTAGGACVTDISDTEFSFADGVATITKQGSDYRWEYYRGSWAVFDSDGCATAAGTPNNVQITISYETASPAPAPTPPDGMTGYLCSRAGGIERVAAILDNSGNPVFSYQYDPQTSNLVGIQDNTGRTVSYAYTSGALTQVTDVRGFAWSYTYDLTTNALISKTDPEGRITNLTYQPTGRVSSIKDQDDRGQDFTYDFISDQKQVYFRTTPSGGPSLEQWTSMQGTLLRGDINGFTLEQTEEVGKNAFVKTAYNGSTTYQERNNFNQITKVVEPDGRETTFEYEPNFSGISRKVGPDGITTRFLYDNQGNVTQIIDAFLTPNQTATNFSYDALGNLTEQILPDGRTPASKITQTYDDFGHISSFTDPEGNTFSFSSFTGIGHADTITDARGKIWRFIFDDAGNILTITNPLQQTIEYTYDKAGNLTKQTDALNNESTFVYNGQNELIQFTDAAGGIYRYDRDQKGRIIKVTDPEGKITTFGYDTYGRRTSFNDGRGSARGIEYATGAEAGGADFFQPKQILFANYTAQLQYDKNSNLQGVSFSDGQGTTSGVTITYDANDNIASLTSTSGKTQRFTYPTPSGTTTIPDPSRITSPRQNRDTLLRFFQFAGAIGGHLGDSLPAGKPTRPTYLSPVRRDVLNRPLHSSLVDPDGNRIPFSYRFGSMGHLERTFNATPAVPESAENRSTTPQPIGFRVYQESRLPRRFQGATTVSNSSGGNTILEYDPLNNLTAITEPNGANTTSFEYDRNNRLTKETKPLGQITQYTYDDAANQVVITDAKTQTTTIQYSDAGLPLSIARGAENISYTYDANGRLTGWNDGTVNAIYTLDPMGRKLSQTVNYGTFSKSNQYTYYMNGRLKSRTSPEGVTYDYFYDDNNQLSRITTPIGPITFSDFSTGSPGQVTYPGGTHLNTETTVFGLPSRIQLTDPSQQTLMDITYTRDADLMMQTKTSQSASISYSYDQENRLTGASHSVLGNETFTYDAANRLTSSNTTGSWVYDANNRLTQQGTTTYTYDNNGNRQSKTEGGTTSNYFYDAANRLIRVEDGASQVIATYGYDPFDRRLWKEVSGVRTYYYYEDEGLTGEFDAAGSLQRSYGYLPESLFTTAPVFMKEQGNYYFYHNDHLGTPQKLTSPGGQVVWSADYNAFGTAQVSTQSTVTNNLRFAGQYYDDETGLHYNFRRYYDPDIGRYLTPDPKGITDDLTLYQYAKGNPINFIDPTGEAGMLYIVVPLFGPVAWTTLAAFAIVLGAIAFATYFLCWPDSDVKDTGAPDTKIKKLQTGINPWAHM